jgi:uncharacterized protein YjiS (DUF1127 family)
MKMTDTASSFWRTTTTQMLRIRHLIEALRSLDDSTLVQVGIDRCEIERFVQAEVALNKRVTSPELFS